MKCHPGRTDSNLIYSYDFILGIEEKDKSSTRGVFVKQQQNNKFKVGTVIVNSLQVCQSSLKF